MHIEAILTATLREWRRSRFAWSCPDDCLTGVGAYAGLLTGTDPCAPWRGAYSDEAGARAILAAGGGAFVILDKAMTSAGLKRVQQAERGDVVCAQFGEEQVGGICLGQFSVFRTPGHGVVELRNTSLKILGAWRA